MIFVGWVLVSGLILHACGVGVGSVAFCLVWGLVLGWLVAG